MVPLTFSFPMFPIDPSENIIKPIFLIFSGGSKVFWCFQGDQRCKLGRKRINSLSVSPIRLLRSYLYCIELFTFSRVTLSVVKIFIVISVSRIANVQKPLCLFDRKTLLQTFWEQFPTAFWFLFIHHIY